jgi:hypothetical protein
LVDYCHYCRYHCITFNNYLLYCNGYEFWLYCYGSCDGYGEPCTISEYRGYFDDL